MRESKSESKLFVNLFPCKCENMSADDNDGLNRSVCIPVILTLEAQLRMAHATHVLSVCCAVGYDLRGAAWRRNHLLHPQLRRRELPGG